MFKPNRKSNTESSKALERIEKSYIGSPLFFPPVALVE